MRMIEVGFLIEASSAAILLRRVTAEQSGNTSSAHATAEGLMAFFSFPQSRRLWPQTEALKGHIARYCHTGDASTLARVEKGVALLLQDHLNETAGGWREHLDPDGINFYGSYPASTLYHLAFAVAELEQLHQAVGR